MFNLPEDIIKYMGLKLDYQELMQLSSCSKLLNNIICNDKMFWINKILAKRPDLLRKINNMMSLEIPNLIRKYMGIEGGTLYYAGDGTDMWKTSNMIERIVKVSCGYNYIAAINEKGELWTFGDNNYGQLGLGNDFNTVYTIMPRRVPFIDKIIKISCGYRHTAIITEKGELWTFGNNTHGRLGLGDNNSRNNPTKVQFTGDDGKIIRVVKVSCGGYHTAIITEKGELWTFGCNNLGQLGLGDYFDRDIPNKLEKALIGDEMAKIGRVSKVSCGGMHTAIITEKGELLTFGNVDSGQLGLGNSFNKNIPNKLEKVQIGDEMSKIGRVFRVSCGKEHTAIVTEKGNLYTCGANQYKQLGLDNSKNSVIRTPVKVPFISEHISMGKINVSCGGNQSAIITEKDELWTFGSNKYGQLGFEGNHIRGYNPSKVTDTKIVKVSCGSLRTAYISLI